MGMPRPVHAAEKVAASVAVHGVSCPTAFERNRLRLVPHLPSTPPKHDELPGLLSCNITAKTSQWIKSTLRWLIWTASVLVTAWLLNVLGRPRTISQPYSVHDASINDVFAAATSSMAIPSLLNLLRRGGKIEGGMVGVGHDGGHGGAAPVPGHDGNGSHVDRCAKPSDEVLEYNLKLHIAGIFIIFGVSFVSCAFATLMRHFTWFKIHPKFFFTLRHFGSGVLLATAFVHLLPSAFLNLEQSCLPEFWTKRYPEIPGAIAMGGVLIITIIEMLFNHKRYNIKEEEGEVLNKVIDAQEPDRPLNRDSDVKVNKKREAIIILAPNESMAAKPNPQFQHVPLHGKKRSSTHVLETYHSNETAPEDNRRVTIIEPVSNRLSVIDPTNNRLSIVNADARQLSMSNRLSINGLVFQRSSMYGNNPTGYTSYKHASAHSVALDPRDISSIAKTGPNSITFNVNHMPHIPDPVSLTGKVDEPDMIDEVQRRRELMQCKLLELGILAHSIFIGITLSVTNGHEFIIFLAAIALHQSFEGLALGARIATIRWEPGAIRPWIMALMYGCTTPTGMAIGLVIHNFYHPHSVIGYLLVGIMNALSFGLLIFAALVELLAEDFLSEESFRTLRGVRRALGFLLVVLGAISMSLVGAFLRE